MRDFAKILRRRLAILIIFLVMAIAACLQLAVSAALNADGTLNQLARVEIEAAQLARQFRISVDDLHGAILRVGTIGAADSAQTIRQQRKKLSDWLSLRMARVHSNEESRILFRLSHELHSYFLKLDGVAEHTAGYRTRLSRNELVMFDDTVNQLEGLADDFAAVHDADLRALLDKSLDSVRWMRNLIFVCVGLLLAAIGGIVMLLYRDVVLPLQAKLFANEKLLLQREKLAALGTLAAGVAHEIRNPLTAIKARLFTLRRAAATPPAMEDLQGIAQEIERLENIVRDVLNFARPSEPKLVEVELSGWLNKISASLRLELETPGVKLLVENPGPAVVRADPDQLRQIILNLTRNARESFGDEAGTITLALHLEKSVLHGRTTEVAVLSVTDNGPGIPIQAQARLFDPFFTTKASGTGLGLSIVAKLSEQNGGEVTYQSAARVGTRFAVHLPICSPATLNLP